MTARSGRRRQARGVAIVVPLMAAFAVLAVGACGGADSVTEDLPDELAPIEEVAPGTTNEDGPSDGAAGDSDVMDDGGLGAGDAAISDELDRILAAHAEAYGGAERLESVRTVQVELFLVEAELEADILYRAMRPGMARVDVSIDGAVVFTEAFDGTYAWQQFGPGTAIEPSSREGAAALRRGAVGNLYSLHEVSTIGYSIEMAEGVTLDGTDYIVLEVIAEDGDSRFHYLDAETMLVARQRATHALHPDIDATEQATETRYSDFRTVDGIQVAFRSVERALESGDVLQSIEIRGMTFNPDIDPTIFGRPVG